MKNIIIIILTTFLGSSINAQVIPFGFIKSTNLTIPSVTIGPQVWTDKNLDVTTYLDGTVIPQVTDATTWKSLTTGAWCYYNNDPSSGYGKLYNWYAVRGITTAESATPTSSEIAARKKLAPEGWHIPTDAEWTTLTTSLGGVTLAGGKMKSTGTSLWISPNRGATNESGFTGLPGGYRDVDGAFYSVGYFGVWWSATEYDSPYAWYRLLYYGGGELEGSYYYKKVGFSVRCLRD